jgi:thiamine-monophosphate kinase
MDLGPGAEFDLIRAFLRGAISEHESLTLGPGDDCALIRASGEIALSTDMAVEGVHFHREWITPREIGYRASAAALSDLAAMAARPIGILVSLAVSSVDARALGAELMQGVRDATEAVGGVLLGGDLTRSRGDIVLNATVVGECRTPLLRSGAHPGDEVWVTGELGGASLAVSEWLAGRTPPEAARERFAAPAPRIPEALWLAGEGLATAMLDISDGLAGDASHLAAASGVAVVLDLGAIPYDERLFGAMGAERMRFVLAGGEDYELCFSAPAGRVSPRVAEFEREFGTRLTRVGWVEAAGEHGPGVFVREEERLVPLTLHGFQHFRGGA